ncbi:MAG: hypothetical protein JRJ58_10445 [Deltaproteobacteria bacterium]|nr:hypothetical protein [Deltaproteobacteria bacterium]
MGADFGERVEVGDPWSSEFGGCRARCSRRAVPKHWRERLGTLAEYPGFALPVNQLPDDSEVFQRHFRRGRGKPVAAV